MIFNTSITSNRSYTRASLSVRLWSRHVCGHKWADPPRQWRHRRSHLMISEMVNWGARKPVNIFSFLRSSVCRQLWQRQTPSKDDDQVFVVIKRLKVFTHPHTHTDLEKTYWKISSNHLFTVCVCVFANRLNFILLVLFSLINHVSDEIFQKWSILSKCNGLKSKVNFIQSSQSAIYCVY